MAAAYGSLNYRLRRRIKLVLISSSRVVNLTKVWLLSFAALALGLLFIYPQIAEQKKLFSVSVSGNLMDEAQSIRMTNIRYYGVDNRQSPIFVTADKAEEKVPGSQVMYLDNPKADMAAPGSEAVNIRSKSGVLDQKHKKMTLHDAVEIVSSNGYEMQTEQLDFDLDTHVVTGNRQINARGEIGNLVASGVIITDGGKKVFFTGDTTINLFEGSLK